MKESLANTTVLEQCYLCLLIFNDTFVHAGRATAVVGGKKAERAELSSNRTVRFRHTTKARARTKGATDRQLSPKVTGMYERTTPLKMCFLS